MRRRLATAATILVLLMAAGCGIGRTRGTSVAEVDARIRALIPAGAHQTRVAAVLDSLRVERSAYDPRAHEMRAIWRKTSVQPLTHSDIQARFVFDDQGALVLYDLKKSFTGP